MKHKLSITITILAMFLAIQFLGLYVVDSYSPVQKQVINPETGELENVSVNPLPKIFQTPEPKEEKDFWFFFIQIIPAFIIAILLIIILSKYKLKFFMRLWFFVVIVLALYLTINAFLMQIPYQNMFIYSIIIAFILAIVKIYRPHFIFHNITEFMIYPGIAAVFVPILNIWTVSLLLVLISFYDVWAVWHSGIMQKMAKFQMNELKIFGGLMIPYFSEKVRNKIKKIKQKAKKAKTKKQKQKIRNKKVKISLAILGGGDIVFPIIAAGVVMRTPGFSITDALFVTFGALAGLTYLMIITKKNKYYPAMPFITAGIFIGLILSLFI